MTETGLMTHGGPETAGFLAESDEPIVRPQQVSPADARELTQQFLARLDTLEEGTAEYQYVRNTLIEMNLSLVRYAASRFCSRGDEMEDIVQVGTIGLIKAIDRFQISREVAFTTFAVPYIVGEIRRFFRDTTWAVHVPRRLQEARVQLARAGEELRSRLGREPTVAELAALMSLPESEVIEARKAANGYTTASLDAALSDDSDDDASLADFIGTRDTALDMVEDFQTLAPAIAGLDERDRKLLHYRFVDELTQAEIGERLGVSQMHVSRLLTRLLARLRRTLTAEEPAPATAAAGPARALKETPAEVPAPAAAAEAGSDAGSDTAQAAAEEGTEDTLVGLRRAEQLLGGLTLAALRWARANDDAFPAPAGKRGTQFLYRLGDLETWAAQRPRAAARLGRSGPGTD
ncbi:RNA polymerase sigma-70 factor, sigma-B/F/G subfamily [Streptomyces albus]